MAMFRSVIFVLLSMSACFGQTKPTRQEFEVASIRPAADPRAGQVQVGLHIDGAMVRCNYFSLKDYIGMAYQVKPYQVSGPDWISSQRFDIAAKLPAASTQAQVTEMLQSLLADRFHLEMHREKKDLPALVLVVGKGGSRLKPTPPDAKTDEPPKGYAMSATGGRGGTSVNLGNGSFFAVENDHFEARKLSMTTFADTLSRFVDRPVVDMTSLTGFYDFRFDITPEDFRALMVRAALANGVVLPPEALKALEGTSDESLLSGIEAIGLKLERRKAPIDVIVVDRILKEPTEN